MGKPALTSGLRSRQANTERGVVKPKGLDRARRQSSAHLQMQTKGPIVSSCSNNE